MTDGTEKTIITPVNLLGQAPATERKGRDMGEPAYDPGAVARSNRCSAHDEVTRELGALHEKADTHEKRGDRIERTIERMDGKLDGLSEKSTGLGVQVSGLGIEVGRLEGRIDAVATDLSKHGVKSRWSARDWAVVAAAAVQIIALVLIAAQGGNISEHLKRTDIKTDAPATVAPAQHILAHP